MTGERTILCYGDSNTWGYIPGSGGKRYPRAVSWPGLLQAEVGVGYRVIDEGLSGRTTVFDDPLAPYRNGRDHLVPCLLSHKPVSLVIIFLGTNDLAARHGRSAHEIACGAASLAAIVRNSDTGPLQAAPKVLLVAPPRLGSIDSVREIMAGCSEKARRLPVEFARAAAEVGVPLLDLAATAAYSDVDGIHLDAEGHRAVAAAILGEVRLLAL